MTVTASGQNHADVMTTINVINDEILSLTTDFSSNTTSDSVDSLVTKQDTFTVTGVTAPGATVQADNDGNGAFDEVSTVADGSGNYSLDVPLVHTSANNGMNVVQLRAVIPAESISTTTDQTNVHRAVGSVVRFETNQDFDNDGNLDFFDAELLDADAPITVANFLSYTTTAATGTERFDDLIVQRLARTQTGADFIIQAGRYNIDGLTITEVDRDADNDGSNDTITNEFNSNNSNIRGTLSMALPSGQPDGGSSEWFINISDANNFLDAPSRLHTVFGRIIGSGMDIVDAINQSTTYDVNSIFNQFALSETPLIDPLTSLSGTAAISANSNVITGTNTLFTSELSVGDLVIIGGGTSFVEVTGIVSDTEMTIDVQAQSDNTGLSLERFAPRNEDFTIFTNIGEILDSI